MPRRWAYGSDTTTSVCSAVTMGRAPRSDEGCKVSLPIERSREQRDQDDSAGPMSLDTGCGRTTARRLTTLESLGPKSQCVTYACACHERFVTLTSKSLRCFRHWL